MLVLKGNGKKVSNPLMQPKKIELVKKTTKIGRSADHADIVMDSSLSPRMISRTHAQITRLDNQYIISCTGMNGMLVNSVKIKKCLLEDGDIVVFGGAGVKTPEGGVISKLQSELVYVFRSPKYAIEDKESFRDLTGGGSLVDSSRNREKQLHRKEDSYTPKNAKAKIAGQSSITCGISSAMSYIDDHYSAGEGTSDGTVSRKRKKRFMMVQHDCNDDDGDDDDWDKSRHSKLLSKEKGNSSHNPNNSPSEDTNGGILSRRKKKRIMMPFDSDDDSTHSPAKKTHKTDSSIIKNIKRNTTEERLEPEINDKDFLKDLNEELLCCICRELLVLTHALPCSHTFCYPCIQDWLRQAQDCPSCRAKSTFDHLVPVKVLDNTVDKVASRVLNPDLQKERQTRIQELQDKINGRMNADTELKVEYAHVQSRKEHCEKCNLPISNRLLRWVLHFPKTSCTAYYHLKCFKPPKSVTMSQITISSGLSKTDVKKIRTLMIRS